MNKYLVKWSGGEEIMVGDNERDAWARRWTGHATTPPSAKNATFDLVPEPEPEPEPDE